MRLANDTHVNNHASSNVLCIIRTVNFIPFNYQRNYDINFEYGQLFHASTNTLRICCRRCFPDSRGFSGWRRMERTQHRKRERGEGEGEGGESRGWQFPVITANPYFIA